MLCPVAHNHLSRAIVELVVGGQFLRDRLAQFRNARAGCVFCKSCLQRFDRGLFDVLRRVEIRLASTEAADVDAFGFHRFGFAINRKREGGTELSGAFGNFHGNGTSREVVQNESANYWRR